MSDLVLLHNRVEGFIRVHSENFHSFAKFNNSIICVTFYFLNGRKRDTIIVKGYSQ
jgi:hypothetical protein